MIRTHEDRIDRSLRLSKYFRKHYIVEEAELDDFECPYCQCIFSADWKWFKYTYRVDGEFAEIGCPYCRRVFLSAT